MKKLLFSILYLSVLFLFVLPPVFVKPVTGITEVSIQFSVRLLANLFVAFAILLVKKDLYPSEQKPDVFRKHALVLTGFGSLLLVSALFELAGFILLKYGVEVAQSKAVIPSGLLCWISFAVAVVSAAFFEEVIYRFFLPEAGIELTSGRFKIAWEIFSVVIFALGHRYLGWLGVLNGLCCGILLRLLFKKSKSIWINTGVHTAYNLLIFIFSAVM